MAQWLRVQAFIAGGTGLIPGRELKSCMLGSVALKKRKERIQTTIYKIEKKQGYIVQHREL